MSDTTGHKPESWFWEAGSEHCPHGAEPDHETQPEAWDTWYDRHTGSPQGVRICLDAPAGDVCGACSDDNGEAVPWADCRVLAHGRPRQGQVPNPDTEHQPVAIWVGTPECLDRECDEYFTEGGDEKPGVEVCSHIREETACSCQRQADGEYVVGEPCPSLRLTPAA